MNSFIKNHEYKKLKKYITINGIALEILRGSDTTIYKNLELDLNIKSFKRLSELRFGHDTSVLPDTLVKGTSQYVFFDIEITKSIFLVGFYYNNNVDVIYLTKDNFDVEKKQFFEKISNVFSRTNLCVGFNSCYYDNHMISECFRLIVYNDIDWCVFIKSLLAMNERIISGKESVYKAHKVMDAWVLDCYRSAIGGSLKKQALKMGFFCVDIQDFNGLEDICMNKLISYNIRDLIYTKAVFLSQLGSFVAHGFLIQSVGLDPKYLNLSSGKIGTDYLFAKAGINSRAYLKFDYNIVFSLKKHLHMFSKRVYSIEAISKFVSDFVEREYICEGTRTFLYDPVTGQKISAPLAEINLGDIFLNFGEGGINSKLKQRVFGVVSEDQVIVEFDLTSAYPNAINITSATYVWPPLLEKIRVEFEVLLRAREGTSDDSSRAAYKLALNCVYGYLRARHTCFFNPELSLLVTTFSNMVMLSLFDIILKHSGELIFVSTDGSAFVTDKSKVDSILLEMKLFLDLFGMSFQHSFYSGVCIKDSKNYVLYDVGRYKGVGIYREWSPLVNVSNNPIMRYISDSLKASFLNREVTWIEPTDPVANYQIKAVKNGCFSQTKGGKVEVLGPLVAFVHVQDGVDLLSTAGNNLKDGRSILILSGNFDPVDLNLSFYKDHFISILPSSFVDGLKIKSYNPKTASSFLIDTFEKNYKIKHIQEFLVPGKLVGYLKGVKLNESHYNLKRYDICKFGLLCGRSRFICIDLDYPKKVGDRLLDLLADYCGETLIVYKEGTKNQPKGFVFNKETLLNREARCKFFFKIPENIDDRELFVQRQLSAKEKDGIEILWRNSAPFVWGENTGGTFYQIYDKQTHIKMMSSNLFDFFIKEGYLKEISTENIAVESRAPSGFFDESGFIRKNTCWESTKDLLSKWVSVNINTPVIFEESLTSIAWYSRCPREDLHTTKGHGREFTVKFDFQKQCLFVKCFHTSCYDEILTLYKDAKNVVSNNLQENLFEKNTAFKKNTDLYLWPTGGGKTYLAAKKIYKLLVAEERFIFFTTSYENVQTIFDYIKRIDKEHNTQHIKEIEIIARGRKFNVKKRYILTYHTYLGIRGVSNDYFSLLKNVILLGLEGTHYHIIVDEIHSLLNSTLRLTFEITAAYRKIRRDKDHILVKHERVSTIDLLKKPEKYLINKCFYNTTLDEKTHIITSDVQKTIYLKQSQLYDTIGNPEQFLQELFLKRVCVKELSGTYTIYKSFLNLENVQAALLGIADGKYISQTLGEVLETWLKLAVSVTIIETKPTYRGELIGYPELLEIFETGDFDESEFVDSHQAPWVKKISMLNILPLLAIRYFAKSITLLTATLASSEKALLGQCFEGMKIHTWDKEIEHPSKIKEIRFFAYWRGINLINLCKLSKALDAWILKFESSKRRAISNFQTAKEKLAEDITLVQHLATFINGELGLTSRDLAMEEPKPKTVLTYLKSSISTGVNLGLIKTTVIDASGVLPSVLIPNFSNEVILDKENIAYIILLYHMESMITAFNQSLGRMMRSAGDIETTKFVFFENVTQNTYFEKLMVLILENNPNVTSASVTHYIPKPPQIHSWAKLSPTNKQKYREWEFKHIKQYLSQKVFKPLKINLVLDKRKGTPSVKQTLQQKTKGRVDKLTERILQLFKEGKSKSQILRGSRINYKKNSDIQQEVINNLPNDIISKIK